MDLKDQEQNTPIIEVDFMGVALSVKACEKPGYPHVIQAADPRGDLLSIKFWPSVQVLSLVGSTLGLIPVGFV